jgi:hypothetical protein
MGPALQLVLRADMLSGYVPRRFRASDPVDSPLSLERERRSSGVRWRLAPRG